MDQQIEALALEVLSYPADQRDTFLDQVCPSSAVREAVRKRIDELVAADDAPTSPSGSQKAPPPDQDQSERASSGEDEGAPPTEPLPGAEWPTIPYREGRDEDAPVEDRSSDFPSTEPHSGPNGPDGAAPDERNTDAFGDNGGSAPPPTEPLSESDRPSISDREGSATSQKEESAASSTSADEDDREDTDETETQTTPASDQTSTRAEGSRSSDSTSTAPERSTASTDSPSSSELGKQSQRVGPWRLVDLLGRGGMGAVYLAERADGQFQQQSALKLIRHDLGPEAQKRFVSERQILAQLQHPNIAHLLDGGVTDDGRPYFAMEYVDGTPINTYCNEHELGIEERLRLFQQICEAVQFAHSNLIVHRDLKPTNILVADSGTETDRAVSTETSASGFLTGSGPQVKLLDFGIAKALEGAEGIESYTKTGEGSPMTPSYAAPEQVQGDSVTTATDVYAMGVVLCELLSGALPYDVRGRSPVEAAQIISETDPTPPSQLVEENPESEVVASCGRSANALKQRLRGDLDVIAQKALRKEPDRRYASATNLGQDIGRHLNGLPVEARPATTGYRLRRFVARNRTAVIGAAVALVALLLGLSASIWQAQVAATERDRAQRNADRAEAVQTFLVDMIGQAAPAVTGGEELTVREVLDEARTELESATLQDQPEVSVEVRRTASEMYRHLEQGEAAVEQGRKAYETGVEELGPGKPLTLKAGGTYGLALRFDGQVERADSLYGAIVPRLERADADPEIRASLLTRHGTVLQDLSQTDSAEAVLHRALDWHDRTGVTDTLALAQTLSRLGYTYLYQRRFDDGEKQYKRALNLIEERGSRDRNLMMKGDLKNDLAILYRFKGDYDQAEEMYRDALDISRQLYGEGSADAAMTLNNLSSVLEAAGKLEEANRLSAKSLALHREHYDPSNHRIGYALRTRIDVLEKLSRLEEAIPLAQDALEIFASSLGSNHLHAIGTQETLSDLYWKTGNLRMAARHGEEALSGYQTRYDSSDARIPALMSQLGAIRTEQGRHEQAEKLLLEARSHQESDSATVAKTRERLLALYEVWPQSDGQ